MTLLVMLSVFCNILITAASFNKSSSEVLNCALITTFQSGGRDYIENAEMEFGRYM